MDPDDINSCIDLRDEGRNNVVEEEDDLKLLLSDSESDVEIVNLENEFEEDQKSTTDDEIDDGKSVHIIFVRDEHEGSNEKSKEKLCTANSSVDNESEEKGVTVRSPLPKVRVSAVPCISVSCPNEVCDTSGEVSRYVCVKNADVEVEDDFDASEEMIFQVDQKSPLPCDPRKRRKKKFCKACGVSIDRKDFLSHIREHRQRKWKFAQNMSPNIIERSVKTLEHPNSSFLSTEKISTHSDSSRTVTSIECEPDLPQSSLSNSVSDRPFKCSVCTETFRTQSSLTIHFKSHSAECSNSCPVS